VGNTRMDEFGMGSHSIYTGAGPVRNVPPYEDRSAGGSSGGSAVAVALGLQEIALGSDTGGSVRLPAAYTGVLGFKPSYGRLSRYGLVPYANSLDTVGIFAKDTSLIRNAMAAMQGHDSEDPTSFSEKFPSHVTFEKWHVPSEQRRRFKSYFRPLASPAGGENGKEAKNDVVGEENKKSHSWSREPENGISVPPRTRIGFPLEYNIEELHPEVRKVWQYVLHSLENRGCEIIPISLPSTKHALPAYYVLAAAEAASNLAKYDGIRYGSRPDMSDAAGDVLYSQARGLGFGEEVKRRILLGSYSLSSEAIDNHFKQAQKIRRLVQRDFDRVFALPNPTRAEEQFDLSEIEESVTLDDKLGPAQVDFIVCPTAPTRPPLLANVLAQTHVDSYMNDVFTVPASLAGLPAISVPIRISQDNAGDNVPWIGIQVIGQFWDDLKTIQLASQIQALPMWTAGNEVRR
jgi:aspartyl-tRNA(Asn)/glutamyl-tRNA(Gln) amidotransferase subunit A